MALQQEDILKIAQLVPGNISIYRVSNFVLIPLYISKKVASLSDMTIEEYKDGYGWVQIQKTTDKNVWGQFINLSAFSKIVGLTRAQLRYQLGL